MTDLSTHSEDTYENDSWLSSMFAAAAGPFVDMAFAERILARLRKKERVRTLVILGTAIFAATLTVWQASGLVGTLPTPSLDFFRAPDWLSGTRAAFALTGVIAAGFAVWMVAEEA